MSKPYDMHKSKSVHVFVTQLYLLKASPGWGLFPRPNLQYDSEEEKTDSEGLSASPLLLFTSRIGPAVDRPTILKQVLQFWYSHMVRPVPEVCLGSLPA